jgi:hypothetical protein
LKYQLEETRGDTEMAARLPYVEPNFTNRVNEALGTELEH